MATNKKTIDVIGSIDDYASEPPNKDPQTRVEENEDDWKRPTIVLLQDDCVLAGIENIPKKATPPYMTGENRWGDKVVWPLHPYCVHCSPAASKPDDTEKTSTFDEYGAERTLSKRESRLMGLTPSQYFSFTLCEINGEVTCTKCGHAPDADVEKSAESRPYGIQKEIVFEKAVFDVAKPMLGIKVDEGLFRFPEVLVTNWVESLYFDSANLYVVRKHQIYSIDGKTFMKHAIYEEGNKQWLLNPDYCIVQDTLEGEIREDKLWVSQTKIKEWRLTAIPLDLMILKMDRFIIYLHLLRLI